MHDYSKYTTTSAIPEASSMIETFRAIGYNLETAVADIIDNSISANAKNVWVNFIWNGKDSSLSIRDDGDGMNEKELIDAMRPGSKSPMEERSPRDLGRFGLGLKTASFSQCRRLTLISKKANTETNYWCWDLDYVKKYKKWELIKYLTDSKFIAELDAQKKGTIIVWEYLDRLVKDADIKNRDDHKNFLNAGNNVKKHLAMVFHRYIENGKLKLFFNNKEINAWDPFLKGFPGSQVFPDETFQNGMIVARGYVLPHKSKLTEEEFRNAEGPKGWNEQQGFYIYRNERLLVAGDWLGMFRKEEHYKLARILIDFPNSVDVDWQIDIKKSIARPPFGLHGKLKTLASKVRNQAVEVYRHKGRTIQRQYAAQEFHMVWSEKIRHGKRYYEINRDHPIIKEILSEFPEVKTSLKTLLKFVEETVPVPLITIRESEQPEVQGQPFEGIDQEPIRKLMAMMFKKLTDEGKTKDEAKGIILTIEPFNIYPQFIEYLN